LGVFFFVFFMSLTRLFFFPLSFFLVFSLLFFFFPPFSFGYNKRSGFVALAVAFAFALYAFCMGKCHLFSSYVLCLVSNVFLLDRDVLELSHFYLVCDLHVLLSAHTWIVFGSSIVSYT
jgi:hypothetical protein